MRSVYLPALTPLNVTGLLPASVPPRVTVAPFGGVFRSTPPGAVPFGPAATADVLDGVVEDCVTTIGFGADFLETKYQMPTATRKNKTNAPAPPMMRASFAGLSPPV